MRLVLLVSCTLLLTGCGATFDPGAVFASQDYGLSAVLNLHWGDGSEIPYDRYWDTSAYQMRSDPGDDE